VRQGRRLRGSTEICCQFSGLDGTADADLLRVPYLLEFLLLTLRNLTAGKQMKKEKSETREREGRGGVSG